MSSLAAAIRRRNPDSLAKRAARSGSVRIIGGSWRSRRLPVLDDAMLRPSADRTRERLFNWLAPDINGARCLDLFAGSGVLAFEALSRGATSATLVEQHPPLINALNRARDSLAAENTAIIQSDAVAWLAESTPTPFDIVFVDPPFRQQLAELVVEHLQQGWLSENALVYVETEPGAQPPCPQTWTLHRNGATRQVDYALYRAQPGEQPGSLPD